MNRPAPHLLLALCLALLTNCSGPDTGSAQFTVSVPQSLSSSISRVSVIAIAADFPSVSVDLVSTSGVWGGTLGNLPAGANRTFVAQAFDASGARLFEGSASAVSIAAEQTTLIAITLQQVNASPPFQNEVPLIDSLVASSTSTSVLAGSTLSLFATAHDPNPGDTLTYAWTSTAGSFSSTSSTTTIWTAPASTGIHTLTITVTDSKGVSSSMSLAVYVIQNPAPGAAQFSITFNSHPRVTAINASPTRLAMGQTTAVSVSASDLDGDGLSYSWSASCAGSWAHASSSSAQFTPSAQPAGDCNNCNLTVTVSDERGGQTTGTLALCISSKTTNHLEPVILSASGSSGTATPGQVLAFEVGASDPEGSALSFSWAANMGVLGTPTHSASTSRITWTAPSCITGSTPTRLTATVTNAFNLKVTQGFSVTGLPVCPEWVSTSSMIAFRTSHTATLLTHGKVLVSGGIGSSNLATAEMYDPTSGTWSATGTMTSARYNHMATRLPNGKVLVSGGLDGAYAYVATAEVYDPATGIWSTTGSMTSPRYSHTSTLLLDGKVLVTGGRNGSILATAEVYDPATGNWSSAGTMTMARTYHTATLLPNGKVLITGGLSSLSDPVVAEVYDPSSGTWNTTGAMASPHAWHTATLLTNGKVLVAGKYGSNPATAEVYDPATGKWSTTGAMTSSRTSAHTATLLTNGKVLVAGGNGTGGNLATAEVYDPTSGTWSTTAAMASNHAGHTATLLDNGKVLVSGSNISTNLKAELYTP